jgi:hypothetical protein
MNVGDSVRLAILDWARGEPQAAMLHGCNAVDGTAKKAYPKEENNARFTRMLRENYGILGPMGLPGIDLQQTRFPVRVLRPNLPDVKPDIADVIYGVHRCCHAHGDELPDGFDLIPNVAGPDRFTECKVERGKVRLSDRILFALLAVAVLSPTNTDQRVPEGFHLTFADHILQINEWWGRASDFAVLVAMEPTIPNVKLDFGDWMVGR